MSFTSGTPHFLEPKMVKGDWQWEWGEVGEPNGVVKGAVSNDILDCLWGLAKRVIVRINRVRAMPVVTTRERIASEEPSRIHVDRWLF
jgi:hypothetical protein